MDNYSTIKDFLESKIRTAGALSEQQNIIEAYRISILITETISFYKRYWGVDFSDFYPNLIAVQPAYPLVLSILSKQLADQNMYDAAAKIAETASKLNTSGNVFLLMYATALREAGDISAARIIANKLLEIVPNDGDAISELANCQVDELFLEQDYYDILNLIHKYLHPNTYLEIGVALGRSMALARTGTTCVGVDPDTGESGRLFFHSPENKPQLFRTTSDDFFSSYDLNELLGGKTVDIAFLDGLHLFEQTLKDFINTERYAKPGSIILIHDCLPVNSLVAERKRQSGFWLGDVWKIIPCLRAVRPDLVIVTLPVKPSGLAVIRNLDPSSRVMARQFDSIVEHFNTLSLPEDWEEKCRLCCVTEQSPEQALGITLD